MRTMAHVALVFGLLNGGAPIQGVPPQFHGDSENEKKGVARVEIYTPMQGPMNPVVAKTQAAAKALASRFPVNNMPMKQCPSK